MRDHELRQRAVGEMHLRRWPLLPLSSLIVQWVIMVDEANREIEIAQIQARTGAHAELERPTHLDGRISPSIRFAWERHSEGSSLTLFVEDATSADYLDPATHPELQEALAWVDGLPGEILRSTRIWLAASEDDVVRDVLPHMDFHEDELVSCYIGGAMRLWSDFRIKDGGFGRLIVAANGADRRDATRQIQRLQELGNYRNRALLGLPLARRYWPELDQGERRLCELSDKIAQQEERDDTIMESLSVLALDLATIMTAINFRMDATQAYARLVDERLQQLDEVPIAGYMSLAGFTQRRFLPAINTCAATVNRVERLAVRAEQMSSLLRARIDTRIENQNALLLRSMERSISVQVRLQQLVEGLSVVALSYYLIGLISYALHGLGGEILGLEDEQIVGLLVVPVLVAMWLTMHALKKRLLGKDRV